MISGLFAIVTSLILAALLLLAQRAWSSCWHEWEGFPLEPWQERGFALFVVGLRDSMAKEMFWERNACNDRCKKCGAERYEVGQGYVPPWYFEEEYQRKHPKTIAKGVRSAPFHLSIISETA